MANTASTLKRARQAITSNLRNSAYKSKVRTHIKKVIAAIDKQNKTAAQEEFKIMVPLLDKSATKNIFSKNKVARHKSRLNAKIKKLA